MEMQLKSSCETSVLNLTTNLWACFSRLLGFCYPDLITICPISPAPILCLLSSSIAGATRRSCDMCRCSRTSVSVAHPWVPDRVAAGTAFLIITSRATPFSRSRCLL